MTSEIRIFDVLKEGPPVLVPLADVLRAVIEFRPDFLNGTWKLVGSVWGYGERVCQWDDITQRQRELEVSGDEIWRVLGSGEEYVEDARFVNGAGWEFGVFDATWIFFKVPDDIASRLESLYQMTRRASDDRLEQ